MIINKIKEIVDILFLLIWIVLGISINVAYIVGPFLLAKYNSPWFLLFYAIVIPAYAMVILICFPKEDQKYK